jgi:hypothetical protein
MFLLILNTQRSITWVGNPYTKTSLSSILEIHKCIRVMKTTEIPIVVIESARYLFMVKSQVVLNISV